MNTNLFWLPGWARLIEYVRRSVRDSVLARICQRAEFSKQEINLIGLVQKLLQEKRDAKSEELRAVKVGAFCQFCDLASLGLREFYRDGVREAHERSRINEYPLNIFFCWRISLTLRRMRSEMLKPVSKLAFTRNASSIRSSLTGLGFDSCLVIGGETTRYSQIVQHF